jgi:hypothetical protein
MLKEALAGAELALGPEVALVIFFVFMLLVGLWLLRPGAAGRYKVIGASLLDEQETAARPRKGMAP